MSKWLENTQKWLDAPNKWERSVEKWMVEDDSVWKLS